MNKITTLSVAVSLLLAWATATAAKCKYETDTTNIFTEEKVRWTKWDDFSFFNTQGGYIAAVAEGDRRYLAIQVVTRQDVPVRPTKEDLDTQVVIPAGSKLLVLLADGSVVELQTEVEVIGDSEIHAPGTWYNDNDSTMGFGDDYMIRTYAVIKYPLDETALAALTTQGVTTLRQTSSSGDKDYKISEKRVDRIQLALACVQ